MRTALTAQYDSLYATNEVVFSEGGAMPAVLRLSEHLASGRVLDVGGGNGRHALVLARAGFMVTVTDLSSVGLEKLQAAAVKEKLSIETRVSDVVSDDITGEYDGVVCTCVLHHMSTADAAAVIAAMQEHTTHNGVHVVATFLNRGGLYERNKHSGSGRYYPSLAELRAVYADWEIVECFARETKTLAKDKHGAHMSNDLGIVVARRPRA